MIVRFKEDAAKKEIEVCVVYPQMNKDVKRIEAALRSTEQSLTGLADNQTRLIRIADILYIESVEKRIFIYTAAEVYKSDQTLISLEEKLYGFDFMQISKSCLLNLNHLVSVKPIFNAKMEALLTNNEKVNISRKFVDRIKAKLEEM